MANRIITRRAAHQQNLVVVCNCLSCYTEDNCRMDVVDSRSCSAMWWDSMTTRQPTAHYHRSQQQELATVLVLVGGDSQDARAIHGSSRSVTVHPSAFVLNGLRLVVVATPGWRNGHLLSTWSDDDDDDCRLSAKVTFAKFFSYIIH